jgi:aminoglycoside 2'-N-acetyltransferase I
MDLQPYNITSSFPGWSTHLLGIAERQAIIQLCVLAHESPDFERLFSFLPPDGLHVLGYSGSQLASHAVVTTRWLQPEGSDLLKTAYVDAVSTLPGLQGQGHGSAGMRRLASLVQESHEIACLETERVSFYKRLGWEEWRGPLAGRGEGGLVPTPDQTGIMVLRLARMPPLDLEGQLTIEVQPGRIW